MTTLAQLIVQETKAAIFDAALTVAAGVGLPTTTWEVGDPSRTLFDALATKLEYYEQVAARYVASGFLDLAAQLDDTKWLKTTAYQKYGYTAAEATNATCTVRLTNVSGNVYTIVAQDLTFAQTGDSDVTYRNTTGGTLSAGSAVSPTTLDLELECEVAGTTGSASIGDIGLVTSVLGVTASNTTAAVGVDEESAESIVAGCRAKLESLSPNGAAGAYEYVALNASITGAANVTRARVSGGTGSVTVTLASSVGAASDPDVALVDAALAENALPLGVTLTTQKASEVAITVTPTVYIYNTVNATEDEIKAAVVSAVNNLFASTPIGGDGTAGKFFKSQIISAILQTYPGYVFDVTLASPASDTTLTSSQVATTSITTGDVTVEPQAAP